jgi:hypothetical protein
METGVVLQVAIFAGLNGEFLTFHAIPGIYNY